VNAEGWFVREKYISYLSHRRGHPAAVNPSSELLKPGLCQHFGHVGEGCVAEKVGPDILSQTSLFRNLLDELP